MYSWLRLSLCSWPSNDDAQHFNIAEGQAERAEGIAGTGAARIVVVGSNENLGSGNIGSGSIRLGLGEAQNERIGTRSPIVKIGCADILRPRIDQRVIAGIACDRIISRTA